MSRSVSVPSNAVKVAYASFDSSSGEPDDFDWSLEGMQEEAVRKYPSMNFCSKYIGREDRAVLENKLAYICVSEYCGLVAVSVVPKEGDYQNLGENWARKVDVNSLSSFFGQGLVKQAVFSNGEAIFQPRDGEQKGSMGLGFSSKEGWL